MWTIISSYVAFFPGSADSWARGSYSIFLKFRILAMLGIMLLTVWLTVIFAAMT
jgi:hypothetical protein